MIDNARMFVVGASLGIAIAVATFALSPSPGPAPVTTAPPDADPTPTTVTADAARLFAAFDAPGPATVGGRPVRLSVVTVGDLDLPSGRVVADDPFFLSIESVWFTQWLAPGRHRVSLLVATPNPVGQSTAAALLGDPAAHPARWVQARLPGGFDGDYEIASGVGGFASAEATEELGLDEARLAAFAGRLGDAIESGSRQTNHGAIVAVAEGTAVGPAVAAFQVGPAYALGESAFGLDADGRAIVLLTSFRLLDPAD